MSRHGFRDVELHDGSRHACSETWRGPLPEPDRGAAMRVSIEPRRQGTGTGFYIGHGDEDFATTEVGVAIKSSGRISARTSLRLSRERLRPFHV